MTTMIRWNPVREMMNLREEIDHLFEEAFNFPRLRWQVPVTVGLPLDLAEDDNQFIVKVSVPGLTPDDLDITFSDNVLTIRGEFKEDEGIPAERYHLRERRYGTFARSVTLPVPVKSDEIEAVYENGVLTLYVPKAEEVRPKHIPIKTNGHTGSRKVIEGETVS